MDFIKKLEEFAELDPQNVDFMASFAMREDDYYIYILFEDFEKFCGEEIDCDSEDEIREWLINWGDKRFSQKGNQGI